MTGRSGIPPEERSIPRSAKGTVVTFQQEQEHFGVPRDARIARCPMKFARRPNITKHTFRQEPPDVHTAWVA